MNIIHEIDKRLKDNNREPRERNTFWATETEDNQFDIYHKMKGTKPTNPMDAEKAVELRMRGLVEVAFMDLIEDLLVPTADQHTIQLETNGIVVRGKLDGLLLAGKPIEFKTSYGAFQRKQLDSGQPKTNYLKQLAIYMLAKESEEGYLIHAHFKKDFNNPFKIDQFYQFTLVRNGTKFKCNDIEFDLQDTFDRWKRIYEDYIVPDIEPPSEYKYKYPLEKIDWRSLPKSKIANARNNKAVIGDFQVIYSPFKDLIVEREGCGLGYSDSELKYIKEKTQNYTNWFK